MSKKIKKHSYKFYVNTAIRFFILGIGTGISFAIARDIVFLFQYLFSTRGFFSFTSILKMILELFVIGAITKYEIKYSNNKVNDDEIEV